MYTKLELPVVTEARGKPGWDMEAALEAAYRGLWTTLTRPFAGAEAGSRVRLERWTNAGFRGWVVGVRTEGGEYLGLAAQEYLDPAPLLRRRFRN